MQHGAHSTRSYILQNCGHTHAALGQRCVNTVIAVQEKEKRQEKRFNSTTEELCLSRTNSYGDAVCISMRKRTPQYTAYEKVNGKGSMFYVAKQAILPHYMDRRKSTNV